MRMCTACNKCRALDDSIYCFECEKPETIVPCSKKQMPCLANMPGCELAFMTTPNTRICPHCTDYINGHGYLNSHDEHALLYNGRGNAREDEDILDGFDLGDAQFFQAQDYYGSEE